MYNKGGGGFKTPLEHVNGNSNHGSEVFNNSQKKPLRYSQDSFVKELIGQKVLISLTTQEVFEGILRQLGMYDCLLEIKTTEVINVSGKEITREATKNRIFMKSNIVWIEVI